MTLEADESTSPTQARMARVTRRRWEALSDDTSTPRRAGNASSLPGPSSTSSNVVLSFAAASRRRSRDRTAPNRARASPDSGAYLCPRKVRVSGSTPMKYAVFETVAPANVTLIAR